MEKQRFVALNKQSKKAQKAYFSARRKTWLGGINPVTRKSENPRTYNRSKSKSALSRTETTFAFA